MEERPTPPYVSSPPHAGPPSGTGAPIDPLLERFAARSAAGRARAAAAGQGRPGNNSLVGARHQAPRPVSAGRDGGSTPPSGPGRTRRRHAAKGSRAAALTLSAASTVGLAGYLQHLETAGANADIEAAAATTPVVALVTPTVAAATGETVATQAAEEAVATVVTEQTAAAEVATTATTAVAPVAEVAVETQTSSGLADGTYSGGTYTSKWGPVQVQITVSGGVLTDVTTLQYPDGDRKSVSINNRALPKLAASALAAQSADINTVSGATYTSDDYRQSLQSALDEAAAAALN